MSSSKRNIGQVKLQSVSGPVEMKLLNHRFETVAQGYGKIQKKVPAGLYRLDINAGTMQKSEYISVEPGETFEDLGIQMSFPSSTPIPDTSTYNSAHAKAVSRLSRKPNKRFGHGGRLVLFFRNVHMDANVPIDLSGFSLHNQAFDAMGDLEKDVRKNESKGWAALSADVDPGGYILRNARRLRRSWNPDTTPQESVDLSIWVAPGWTTILFIPNWEGRKAPSLSRTSIYMARLNEGFYSGAQQASDQAVQIDLALELALIGLREGRAVVSADLLNLALNEKFENPMLGIVGAHALLLESKPQWALFDTLCRNLKRLIPDHPDVIAVRLMGKELRENDSSSAVKPVSWPPMIYRAYRGLIARDATEPGLIVDDSPADRIASHLIPDGPWTMWKSLGTDVSATQRRASSADMDSSIKKASASLSSGSLSHLRRASQKADSQALSDPLDPEVFRVAEYVQEISQKTPQQKASKSARKKLGVEALSKMVGLPVSSVKRAIRTISARDTSEPDV